MIGDAPRSYITGVPGWETSAEQALLFALGQDVPYAGVIFEIGSEFGMSASIFAKATEDTAVLIGCVDLYPGDLASHHRQNLVEAGLESDRIQRFQQDSKLGMEINPRMADRAGCSIDLLFIDGDHSYAGVKADIDAWMSHVKIGGRVAFHDCLYPPNFHADHLYQFDIMRAIGEWFTSVSPAWRTLEYVDSIMVFERVK